MIRISVVFLDQFLWSIKCFTQCRFRTVQDLFWTNPYTVRGLTVIRAFFSVPIQIGIRQIALAQNYIMFSEPKILNNNSLQLFNSKCLIVPQCWGSLYCENLENGVLCARGRKFQGLLTQQSLCVIADDQTTNPAVCLEEIISFIKIQPKSQIKFLMHFSSTPPVNLKCNRIAFKSSWLKLLQSGQ